MTLLYDSLAKYEINNHIFCGHRRWTSTRKSDKQRAKAWLAKYRPNGLFESVQEHNDKMCEVRSAEVVLDMWYRLFHETFELLLPSHIWCDLMVFTPASEPTEAQIEEVDRWIG